MFHGKTDSIGAYVERMATNETDAQDLAGEHPVLCECRFFVLRVKSLGIFEEAGIEAVLVIVLMPSFF